MTLVIIKNREVANLPMLKRLVLKSIYDPRHMKATEFRLMEQSFISWHKKFGLKENELYMLERLAWMIKRNEEGKFEKRKELFKRHEIDYRKFHRLPEVMLAKN